MPDALTASRPTGTRARGLLALVVCVAALGAAVAPSGVATAHPPPARPRMTGTLPPGSALPSSARCASRVRHDRWEPRPANYPENHTKGARLVIPAADWRGFPAWRALARRVAGLFTGTTDQIMAWASCKWGFAGDLTRAEALVESHWHQWWVGDGGASVGLMQVKSDGADTPHHYTWPHSRDSTSYNVDYALAWRRACYEGYFAQGGWLPSSSRGDLWGCVGLWYSGVWHRGDAAYVAAVRRALRNRRWLKWEADQRRSRGHCAAATFSELPTPSAALAWLARAE